MIRRACVLLGMLGLFLQGSTGGHLLLVEHTRCAEHGELVHGNSLHHHASDDLVGPNDPAVSGIARGTAEGSHEHCALSADRRDALHLIPGPRIVAYADAAGEVSEPPTTRPTADLGRFRIAPKNSPPA
jgi:hypothetical protein